MNPNDVKLEYETPRPRDPRKADPIVLATVVTMGSAFLLVLFLRATSGLLLALPPVGALLSVGGAIYSALSRPFSKLPFLLLLTSAALLICHLCYVVTLIRALIDGAC